MGDTEWQRVYREEAHVLGRVGRALAEAELPSIEVRLPRALGEQAVAAWERTGNEGELEPETFEQRTQRRRAATLALIGLSIVSVGRWEGDEVIVELHPDLIGVALDAADDVN